MSETIDNPLRELHERAGAEFQDYGSIPIVSTFGQPQAEYAAIHKVCGLMDLPHRGLLKLTGADRLAFLNNLLTNQTWDKGTKSGLSAGQGVYGFFLNGKGRIETDVNVLNREESTFLEMEARKVESMAAMLEKYLFAERVKIEPQSGKLHQLSLHGPLTVEILKESTGRDVDQLPQLGSMSAEAFDQEITIYRDDRAGVPGFYLNAATSAVSAVWDQLIERFAQGEELGKRRLRPVGWAAFNAARIEAGRPMYGIDFDDSVLPAETGLMKKAVSLTKGCYLGQEIVARMHARGQFSRQLVGLRMDGDALPIEGAPIHDEGENMIGGVTSSTVSPVLSNAAIALGYVKRPFVADGTTVCIAAEGQMRPAKVVGLPFVHGD
ncbi:MAG: aminomethyl transferase family protein [Phycisphaerales bacterium]|jgi:folate-binding protein YgfZ|nr:aminomethyl transferase family protein [Phycisphaerales bacterium]